MDDSSEIIWIQFYKRKREITQFVKKLVGGTKGKGLEVKCLRCDNSGNHMDNLKEIFRKEGIDL